RTHRRLIPDANSHRMREVVGELAKINVAVNIAAVIKENGSQAGINWQRKTGLGINDEKHVAAHRHADQRASRLVRGIRTHRHGALRAGAIDRKTAERIRAAGKKGLADRNETSGE